MRNTRSRTSAALLLALLSAGCRLPGREGPVPQSLTDCRRLSQQGVSALERGEQPKAETLLAQAVTACPVDAEARRHYAESLWRRGARQDAIVQLHEASRLAEEDASLWARLAEMYLANGQPELAQQNAERALKLDPKLSTAWAIHGGAMRAVSQPREALADYLRALSYAPTNRAILNEIAELHRELNQPERAIQTLQTLADTYSPGEEPGQVLYLMGLAYVALGRYDDGVESLSAAVTRGGPTPEMFYRLGEAQMLAGHPTEAAVAARQALALQPRHDPSRGLLERLELAQQPQGTIR
jgi:tetratricopeptide (TPR) repeat protein